MEIMELKYTDREKAEKYVEKLRGFYKHCITFCIVNSMLLCINYLTLSGYWWFKWPLVGMGIGLLMHGLDICNKGLYGERWKEHKIEKLIKKYNDGKKI